MSQQLSIRNSRELNELQKNILDLNEIQQNLLECISYQGDKIDTIEEHIEHSNLSIVESNTNLKIADTYFFNYSPILIGTVLGVATFGPMSALLHINIGGLFTVGGGMLGGLMGYKIQKI
tara:strand:- start:90 stop:449 length:360 start_codon:yes stop_codon:yes gene_type:complete